MYTDAAGTTSASVGDLVGRWESWHDRDVAATQATQNKKPTLGQRGDGSLYLDFDGVNDFLNVSGVASLLEIDAVDLWLVQTQMTSEPALNVTTQAPNTDVNKNRLIGYLAYNDTLYFDYGDYSKGARISAPVPTGWYSAQHLVELYRSSGVMELLVDGVQQASKSGVTSTLDKSIQDGFYVGRDFNGAMNNVLLCTTGLSAPDRQRVENVLMP